MQLWLPDLKQDFAELEKMPRKTPTILKGWGGTFLTGRKRHVFRDINGDFENYAWCGESVSPPSSIRTWVGAQNDTDWQ